MFRHRACDSCSALKEKCVFSLSNGSSKCDRCSRTNRQCRLRRPRKKTGRKAQRALGTLDFAFHPIWTSILSECPPSAGDAMTPHADDKSLPGDDEPDVTSSIPDFTTCVLPAIINPLTEPVTKATVPERQLLSIICDKDIISLFTIDPSFTSEFTNIALSCFWGATPLLRDAYIACAASIALDQDLTIEGLSVHTMLPYLSRSIQRLPKFCYPRESCNVTELLYTYLAIMTNMLLSPAGGSARLITVATLDNLRDWYLTTSCVSELRMIEPHLTVAVAEDVAWCLLHRKTPILHFEPISPEIPDRYLGICKSLLPILRQICELQDTACGTEPTAGRFWDISRTLNQWIPTLPHDAHSTFTSSGIHRLVFQARVYKETASILLHKLGERSQLTPPVDTTAMATALLSDISSATANMSSTDIPLIMLPILVAGLEVKEARSRLLALECMMRYKVTVYRHSQKQASRFMQELWAQMDDDSDLRWQDAFERNPQLYTIL